MEDLKQKIESLLLTGDRANIELSLQLLPGNNHILKEYLDFAKMAECKSEEPLEALFEFFNRSFLSLEDKGLKALPDWFFKLPKLDTIYLGNNELECLPEFPALPAGGDPWICYELCLENNRLKELPKSIANWTTYLLDLTNNDFDSFPLEVCEIPGLEILDLVGNNLQDLPKEIGKIQTLRELHLGHNGLKDLPIELLQLKNFTHLDLSNNELSAYPEIMEGLIEGNLSTLNLTRNQLTAFPPYIQKLAEQMTMTAFLGNPIPEEEKEALRQEGFFSLNTIDWESIGGKDYYEEF